MGIGLQVVMGETVAHYNYQAPVFHKMGSGIYGRINFTLTVSRGQDPYPFFNIKVFLQFHGNLLF